MALPDTLLARLVETTKAHNLGGRFLMLGRQRWIGTRKGAAARLWADVIAEHLPGMQEQDLKNPDDIYSERFFQVLGYDPVQSLDFSEFEGASIVHDLTQPIPEELEGQFDVVYDGGTCEHIFNLPKAYANIDRLLKPGGVLIGHSPCNNWINHSFYQINPEMVYGYWEKAMGYTVLQVFLQPLLPNFALKTATTTNPNETGKRPRIRGELPKNSSIVLNYAVRKPLQRSGEGRDAYQTDYMRKWDDSKADADEE